IRVEDLRLAVASKSVLKRLDAERRLHRDRYPPRQHATAEPIEHNGQIDEAARHRDIGVSRPEEFHLRPLAEPDVNLSAHPAPIIHPTTGSPSTNGRMRGADVAPAV